MVFIRRFAEFAREYPGVPAVSAASSEVSYGQLYNSALRVAGMISLTGSGAMIGVMMEKSIDYVVSVLAVHLLGRTVVPLDKKYPIERLRGMIISIDLSLCLLNEQENAELTVMLNEQTRTLNINEPTTAALGTDYPAIKTDISDELPAYVVFTSGTTGQPKPVMLPYRSLTTLIDWMGKTTAQTGTTLLYAAQGFDVAFQEIYSALCQGDRLLIVTDEQKKDLHALTTLLLTGGVTRLFLPTSMLIPLVTFNLRDLAVLVNLREIICAGEPLKISPAVRQWFKANPQCRLINQYGPTETHVVMEHRLEGAPENWPDLPPIGQVTPASTAYLFDDNLQPVMPGHEGQLYIAGSSLALGYYGMSAQTAEKFVRHPQTHERMYNTGDICFLNEQSLFEYVGRRDRQLKIRGYRIELKEIETVAANASLVDECLVVARQSGQTTTLILYFTAQASDQDFSMSLHRHLLARLPDYMLPSFYKKISAIPLTQNGKVDLQQLPQVGAMQSNRSTSYVEPLGELETRVCELAACCFGLDHVGATDNFMDAGANSITLISLLAELRYALAHAFRQTDLFEYPTPRLLCSFYQRSLEATQPHASTVAIASSQQNRSAAIQRSRERNGG